MRRPAFRSGLTNGFPPVCHGRSDRIHYSHRICYESGHGVEIPLAEIPAHLETKPRSRIQGPVADVHPAFRAG
ncbi:chaperone DnaJ [Desmospora sp. 8437]|nr:chaperone DnaJ [Desmospora sp. 8437]